MGIKPCRGAQCPQINTTGHIAIACSHDGVHWSRPHYILDCRASLQVTHLTWRMSVLPVHNGVDVVGGHAYVWLHEDVSGMGSTVWDKYTTLRRYRLQGGTMALHRCLESH